ncbi:unnamed protein product [Adineta ricciae]|uniref:Uncharacterized protein n=1 Tax=Adineta ricciae TaxID=249248 RepID=A0A814YI34_ADIRI|nr:unnamed protein product [Adineta ricciae]
MECEKHAHISIHLAFVIVVKSVPSSPLLTLPMKIKVDVWMKASVNHYGSIRIKQRKSILLKYKSFFV